MIYLDQYAHLSRLKDQDPLLKLCFALITLAAVLWADSIFVSLTTVAVMGWVVVRRGGLPFSVYLRLLALPFSFLVIGVLTIVVRFGPDPREFLAGFRLGDFTVGVTLDGLLMAAGLFTKSLAAVSCLYSLALTTPVVEILAALRKIGLPGLLVELMSLVYRFIFVLLETAQRIYIAQDSRLGYADLRTGYRSTSTLIHTLLFRSYLRAQDLYNALEARGYDGEIKVLEEKHPAPVFSYVAVFAFEGVLVITGFLAQHLAGGIW